MCSMARDGKIDYKKIEYEIIKKQERTEYITNEIKKAYETKTENELINKIPRKEILETIRRLHLAWLQQNKL